MISKAMQTANIGAVLARNTTLPAFECANLTIKLQSLQKKIERKGTFECNGFDNEYSDKLFAEYQRTKNYDAANTLRNTLNANCRVYCDKQQTAINKTLDKLQKELGLTLIDKGVYGLAILINGSEFNI